MIKLSNDQNNKKMRKKKEEKTFPFQREKTLSFKGRNDPLRSARRRRLELRRGEGMHGKCGN